MIDWIFFPGPWYNCQLNEFSFLSLSFHYLEFWRHIWIRKFYSVFLLLFLLIWFVLHDMMMMMMMKMWQLIFVHQPKCPEGNFSIFIFHHHQNSSIQFTSAIKIFFLFNYKWTTITKKFLQNKKIINYINLKLTKNVIIITLFLELFTIVLTTQNSFIHKLTKTNKTNLSYA